MNRFLAGLAAACLAAVSPADDTKWTKIAVKEVGCEAEFPGQPAERNRERGRQYSLAALDGKAGYMLQFDKLQKEIPLDKPDEVSALFERAESGLVKSLGGGRIAKREDGRIGRYPFREVQLDDVPKLGSCRAKFVLTGERFYQVTAGGPADFVKGDDVKRFMGSFKVKE